MSIFTKLTNWLYGTTPSAPAPVAKPATKTAKKPATKKTAPKKPAGKKTKK